MTEGKALEQTYSPGMPDFADSDIVTLSPAGPGKLVVVAKCPMCGFSSTRCEVPEPSEQGGGK